MDLEVFRLAADYYHILLNAELQINEWVQENLSFGEPVFRFISVYLEPGSLFNVWIPLLGIFSQSLLTQLLSMISVVSVLSSFEKWIYPELRPLWWLRELYASGHEHTFKPGLALQSHDLSCETSGGMPCAHSTCLTAFLMIVSAHLTVSGRFSRWRCSLFGLIGCCIVSVWLSRLFLATEFLHQCFLGTYIAVSTLTSFDRHLEYLYSRKQRWTLPLVLLLGALAIAVYFGKQRFDLDPHWSVRQAFKWCPEPTFMRHEASPIFLLTRDLGNLMGVALAAPLAELKSKDSANLPRFVGVLAIESLNFVLRLYTPKQQGRFVFLAYEFTRNACHTLVLLKFLPKLFKRRLDKSSKD